MTGTPANTLDGFWSQVEEHPNGCWLWKGPVSVVHNYGLFRLWGSQRLTHRLAYEATLGPIPADHDLDHECEVKLCVNPLHLTPLTKADHAVVTARRRGDVCRRGHPFTPENTYTRPGGERTCRTCIRASESRRRGRR